MAAPFTQRRRLNWAGIERRDGRVNATYASASRMRSAHDGGKGLACPHLDFEFCFLAAGVGAAAATGGGWT
jgi:hypothetical protein